MRKENVVKLGEVAVDVLTTGATAIKAFNSVTTLLPSFALKSSVRDLEVEKDLALVDFQVQMAVEIYKRTEEEYAEFISPSRREQALTEFTEIADIAFDAFDEIDAKLSLTERCTNIAMKTLVNAHQASVMDKKKEAAQRAYNLIMGITDEETIMSLEHTVIPVVEAAIDEAPATETFTQDKHQEVRQSLAEAGALFNEQEVEEKEVAQIETKTKATVVTHPATQRAQLDESIGKIMNTVLQEFMDSTDGNVMDKMQSLINDDNPEVFERCVRRALNDVSEDELNAIMMCIREHLTGDEKVAQ